MTYAGPVSPEVLRLIDHWREHPDAEVARLAQQLLYRWYFQYGLVGLQQLEAILLMLGNSEPALVPLVLRALQRHVAARP